MPRSSVAIFVTVAFVLARFALVALALVLSATTGRALAQDTTPGTGLAAPRHGTPQAVPRRAVVLHFGGPQSARSRAALIASLAQNGWEIVPDADVQTAQQQGGLTRLRGSQDYARLALATNATAVIGGSTAHRRRTWSVTATVYSGHDGSRLGNATWSAETMSALGAPRQTGFDRLSRYLAQAQPGEAVGPTAEEHPWEPSGLVDEELSEHHDEAPPLEDDDRFDAFSISVLGGTLHRDMSANVNVASPRLHGTEIRSYSSAYIGNFELGLAGEIYPGALLDRQPFPWLGLYLAYRHSLGLSSQGVASDGSDVALPTEEQQVDIGLRGRVVVGGQTRRGLELTAAIDYSLFEYKFDTAVLSTLDPSGVIPPMSYSSLRFAVGGSYPVVTTYLRVGVHLAYRLGLDIGADARAVFGRDTGVADGMDLGVSFRSEAPYVVRGFWFGLDLDFIGYSMRFRGAPRCIVAPGCMSSTGPWEALTVPDRVGDAYVRMTVQVGYAFR